MKTITKLKKGLIIEEMRTFVLVQMEIVQVGKEKQLFLNCVDLHNNIYSLTFDSMILFPGVKFIDPSNYECEHEAMSIVGEVLAGQHDNRFGIQNGTR